jgi:hypothetical protein
LKKDINQIKIFELFIKFTNGVAIVDSKESLIVNEFIKAANMAKSNFDRLKK